MAFEFFGNGSGGSGFMNLDSSTWLGKGDNATGLLEPLGGLAGAGLNYYQADQARKDKIKMFDTQFNYNVSQDKIARDDYLKKQSNEEKAWSNFGQSGDPYAVSSAPQLT